MNEGQGLHKDKNASLSPSLNLLSMQQIYGVQCVLSKTEHYFQAQEILWLQILSTPKTAL